MKKALLLTVAALFLTAGMAVAGKNAGGVLVVHGDPGGLTFCVDQGIPEICEDFVTRIDVAGMPPANLFSWVVVAAFPPNASPTMMSVIFGIEHAGVTITETYMCGDFELPTTDWPASGSGNAMTWLPPGAMDLVTPTSSFVGYNYDGDTGYFTVSLHPMQPTEFGDDSQPMVVDPVAGFGTLGFFQAGDLPCPEVLTEGACCFSDGSCVIHDEAGCTAAGGAFEGIGTVCAPNPCPQPLVRACCFDNGTCQLITEAQCTAEGGDWLGDTTVCSPNPCPQPMGACCKPGGICENTFMSDCGVTIGYWMGANTSCAADGWNCPPFAACCRTNGSCLDRTEVQCDALDGGLAGWHPEWGLCDPNPCPQLGACCRRTGEDTVACSRIFEDACIADAGEEPYVWLENISCTPNPCDDQFGACCKFTGDDPDNPDHWDCEYLPQEDCFAENASNVWNGGSKCSEVECPGPYQPISGACCLADGTCQVRTEDQCTTQGGDWLGAWTTCNPNPCPQPMGACCLPGDYCVLMTQAYCSAANGSWQYHLTSCDPNPCPVESGACCFADGTCQILIEAECESMNGSWEGGGTSCHPNPCLGACCFADGSCWVMPEGLCANVGTWMGSYTTCSPNPCDTPVTGACCFNDGTCEVMNEPDCLAQNGAWLGAGTGCDPNPCEPTLTIESTWGRIKSTFKD